jgi:hypothetical protein
LRCRLQILTGAGRCLRFLLVLFRKVPADKTAGDCSDHAMMNRVTGNTTDDCTLDAAFGVRRHSHTGNRERYGAAQQYLHRYKLLLGRRLLVLGCAYSCQQMGCL